MKLKCRTSLLFFWQRHGSIKFCSRIDHFDPKWTQFLISRWTARFFIIRRVFSPLSLPHISQAVLESPRNSSVVTRRPPPSKPSSDFSVQQKLFVWSQDLYRHVQIQPAEGQVFKCSWPAQLTRIICVHTFFLVLFLFMCLFFFSFCFFLNTVCTLVT